MFHNRAFKALFLTLALGLFLFGATPVFADCYGECMAQNDCYAQYPSDPELRAVCLAAWSAGCWWGCMT